MSEPGSEEENGARRGKVPEQDRDLDYLKSLMEKDAEWDPGYLDCLTDADKKAILEAWAEDARPDSPSTAATHDSEETGERESLREQTPPAAGKGRKGPRSTPRSDHDEGGESSGRAEFSNPSGRQFSGEPPENNTFERDGSAENSLPSQETPSVQKKGKTSVPKRGRYLNECNDPNFNTAFILGQGPPARNLRPRQLNRPSETAMVPVHALDHDDQPGTSHEPEGQPEPSGIWDRRAGRSAGRRYERVSEGFGF